MITWDAYYRVKEETVWQIAKTLEKMGNINQVLKPSNVQRQTTLQIYNILAIFIRLYDNETWTLKEQYKSRFTGAEVIFKKKTHTLWPQ
jgi:hypothetical protein